MRQKPTGRGDDAPELTADDEKILDGIWDKVGKKGGGKTSRTGGTGTSGKTRRTGGKRKG